MSGKIIVCPGCGKEVFTYRNPVPTVDIIIKTRSGSNQEGAVLIKRGRPPWGWALPGGFIDYGESAEDAAVREAKEETGLDVELKGQFRVYSAPDRDPRQHTLSVVFLATASGQPKAGDDAAQVRVFAWDEIPPELAFDHRQILDDYLSWRAGQEKR